MRRKGNPGGSREAAVASVHCARLDRPRTLEEHQRCPYCFGRRPDIAAGDRLRFCDFRLGIDPICFGFPQTHGRHLRD